jgi:formate dehydrogenase iron-sulfur subunit
MRSLVGTSSQPSDADLRASHSGRTISYGVEPNWHPPPAMGFLTDATICIGCKACEVACKQWNQLPGDSPTGNFELTGYSYDNTVDLGATTWRHVAFVERPSGGGIAWLMLSDVCKHCVHAGCLDACPTGAIMRTEYGTVVIQDDICNGCGYCIPACPFGVPQLSHADGGSHKCTLCYDRLRGGLAPACATACPTGSIRFGPVDELRGAGRERVATLNAQGLEDARLYGDDDLGGTGGIGGLNALFVLNAPPAAFNLPAQPRLPRLNIVPSAAATLAVAAGYCLAAAFSFRRRT